MSRLRSCTIGVCPRCLHIRGLSKHHVFPKRFFGNGDGNRSALLLCSECHEFIEGIIPYSIKFTKEQYLELHSSFLRGAGFDELTSLVNKYERKKRNYKNDQRVVLVKITKDRLFDLRRQKGFQNGVN